MGDGHAKRTSSIAGLDSELASKRMYSDFERLQISSRQRAQQQLEQEQGEQGDVAMRGPSSYNRDAYTVVVETLESSDDGEDEKQGDCENKVGKVSLLSEIEKRMTRIGAFLVPKRGMLQADTQNALIPYRPAEDIVQESLSRNSETPQAKDHDEMDTE